MNYVKLFIVLIILGLPAVVKAQNITNAESAAVNENNQAAAPAARAQAPGDELISLDLKGVEINELFKLLAAKSGFTIVTASHVQGRITIALNDLTFEAALDKVLKMQNLVSERSGNVIKIMAAAGVDSQGADNRSASKEASLDNEELSEKITLDLKGVDFGELIKMLSVKSGLTIIATPAVQGRVTVFLNNLSFDDALEVILTLQNLACERTGNLIKIMTAAEYEQLFGKKFSEKKKVKAVKLTYAKPSNISNMLSSLKSDIGKILLDESSGTLILIDSPPALALMENAINELDVPLETAVFDINYANPADIKTYITDLITPGVGQLIIDQRSNKVIVSDLPQRLAKIKKLMAEFDETSRQVLITGEIIQVSLNDKYQSGIDWEHLPNGGKWQGLDLVSKFPATVTADYGKVSVGTLSEDDYTAIINMLQEYGRVETLSRPQVVAVNKEEAKILVGAREAYITQQQSQASAGIVTADTVEFIDVGVKLKVVPTIGKDGFITMKIKPEISSVREILKTTNSQIPIVETSETETVVKIKDGAMIMIGGLIKKRYSDTEYSVPFISKIPVLGNLFKNKAKETTKTELVIFLRAKLISGDIKKPAGSLSK